MQTRHRSPSTAPAALERALGLAALFALALGGCRTASEARAPASAHDPSRDPPIARGEEPDDPTDDSSTDPAAPSEDERRVVLDGRIESSEVSSASGAEIAVFSVGERGALTAISSKAVRTGEDGKFEIGVVLPADGPHDLVVTAVRPGFSGRGSALVPSWAVVDGTIIAPPISVETAVESDVYLAALKSGAWKIHLGSGELRSFISPRVALRIRSSEHYEDDVQAMARASAAAVEAWYKALLRPEVGLDLEHLRSVLEAVGWARVALDAHLFAAESDEDAEEARTAHQVVVRAAYAAVGIGPEQLALAAQASAEAMKRAAPAMSDELRPLLIGDAEVLRAKHIAGAVDEIFSKAGAPEDERAAVRTAGEKLEGRILTASAKQGGSDEELESSVKRAWNEYRTAVQDRLQALEEKHSEGEDII